MDARIKYGHDEREDAPGARRGLAPAYAPTPLSFNAPPISSSTLGSSIVAGMLHAPPSAIFLMVPRRILPERVFGNRWTTMARRNEAPGPILARPNWTHSFSMSSTGRLTPA